MPRAIWKGAVTFGLVYMPVEMYSASQEERLDLDMLDKRDFQPIGYQRINKHTGKVVEWANIIKGYEYKKGDYVALTDEDFRQANVKASQTIEISSFVEAKDIPSSYFETPYYLSPAKGGDKVYALLREALARAGRVAVATLVMRGRQHLCAVLPSDRALMLNTLRFSGAIKPADDLKLPGTAKAAGLTGKELDMAEKLIEQMSGTWSPEQFHDSYREDLMKRIKEKIRKKQTHELTAAEKGEKARPKAEVIDLMAALRSSLESPSHRKPRHARRKSA